MNVTVSFSIFRCSLENGFNRLFIAPNRRIGPFINMPFGDEIPWRCRCVIRRENVDDGQLFTFIRCGRMDLMYTDTAMPGRRSGRLRETGQVGRKLDEHAVRLDGADNAAHGLTDGEQRRVLCPGAEQLAVGERNAPVFRLHGADSRQNGLPATVNRSLGWQMRDTDRFSMPMSDGTPQPASTNAPNGSRCVTRAGITSPGRRESSSRSCAFCWTMVRDSHAVGGSVLSSISVTTKQVGFAYTRQDGNSRVSPSATPSARTRAAGCPARCQGRTAGRARRCTVVRRLPECVLLLRLPQCAER